MGKNKKHSLINIESIVTDVRVKPSILRGSNKKVPSEDIVPDRWKFPILSSIRSFNSGFKDKQEKQGEIATTLQLRIEDLRAYQSNIFEIVLYKASTNSIIKKLQSSLSLKSFYLLKKDFANYSLFISLNYDDSLQFIKIMNQICSSDKIDKAKKVLKLIKLFRLIPYEDLMYLISSANNDDEQSFSICLDLELLRHNNLYGEGVDFNKNFTDLLSVFHLKFNNELLMLQGDVVITEVVGTLSKVRNFLLFFELEFGVFSEFIRTVSYDISGAADIKRNLKDIAVTHKENLPVVCLFDSNLPDGSVLNNILRKEIIGAYKVNNNDDVPETDHAVQMASIISFGKQLLDVNDVDQLCKNGLISHAKIVSIMLGAKTPLFKLDTFPQMLSFLKRAEELSEQTIKICNCSFNINKSKKEGEGLSIFSYLIDRFLFFHKEYVVFSSIGNIKNEDMCPNYYTYEKSNIFVPSEGINIFSVGAASVDERSITISDFSRRDFFDYGAISNQMPKTIKNNQSIKRIRSSRQKPDIVSIGDKWSPAGQSCRLQVFTGSEKKSGTSHAAAYVSHIAACSLSEYPNIQSALSIEALLLNSSTNVDCSFQIDSARPYADMLKNRIDELNANSHSSVNLQWLEKENEFLSKRFKGLSGVVDIESVLFNSDNVKTFIIEGNISIGTLIRQQIDLSDFVNKSILDSSQLTFSGTVVYRGIPFLRDSVAANIVNVSAKIGYFEDYIAEKKYYEKLPDEDKEKYSSKAKFNRCWSSSLGCGATWGNRQEIRALTTRSKNFNGKLLKESLIDNSLKLEILLQSMAWRGKEKDIVSFLKDGLKEFFPNKNDCPDIWKELWGRDSFDFSEVKIPYSVILSVKTNQNINLYSEVQLEAELENPPSLF